VAIVLNDVGISNYDDLRVFFFLPEPSGPFISRLPQILTGLRPRKNLQG
jgi:hypothetical protein